MHSRRSLPVVSVTIGLTVALSLTTIAGAAAQEDRHTSDNVIVNFGSPTNLTGGAPNQVVVPDEAQLRKGGTVTFIVNGPGHGVAIYPVSKNTTRDDITAQLCAHNPVCGDTTFANADHTIVDGKGNTVIVTGTNPPLSRVDDGTDRLLATSTQTGIVPGPFLPGTMADGTAGTRLQFRFEKSGRYLVVCMNRGHYLANWMFGFVTVEE